MCYRLFLIVFLQLDLNSFKKFLYYLSFSICNHIFSNHLLSFISPSESRLLSLKFFFLVFFCLPYNIFFIY